MARPVAFFLGLCVSMIVTVFITLPRLFTKSDSIGQTIATSAVTTYLVDTVSCKIPDLNPYDRSVKQYIHTWRPVDCVNNTKPSITFKDGLWLRINKTALKEYNQNLGVCHLQEIRRNGTDDGVTFVPVISFNTDIKVNQEFIRVQCYNTLATHMSSNFHAFIQPKPAIEEELSKKQERFKTKHQVEKPLNVILLGTDSLSRLNMIRQLPRTRQFLLSHLDAVELQGYNKVGDNTFPNVFALATGLFVEELGLNATDIKRGYFDKYDYIWKRYAEAGYTTLFAEDDPEANGFNYQKRGFLKPPTDYYYRPIALAMENHTAMWSRDNLCFGNRMETSLILDWLEKFLQLSENRPTFSFTFLSRLSHNYVNRIKIADGVYLHFLKNLKAKGLLENSILIFFSDHGIRFGYIRETYVGKMEERLPMMLIALPKWFKEKHPVQFKNLNENTKRLTSTFDIHATLIELLYMNFTKGSALRENPKRGLSLFSIVPANRTCSQAGISPHWCTCHPQIQVPVTNHLVQKLAMTAITRINRIVSKVQNCAQLSLDTVHQVWRSRFEENLPRDLYRNKENETTTDYQITLTTRPGRGMFETTVRHFEERNLFKIIGFISRINRYGDGSYCVDSVDLKLYCFCTS